MKEVAINDEGLSVLVSDDTSDEDVEAIKAAHAPFEEQQKAAEASNKATTSSSTPKK
jgi:hypothetical protein